MTLETLKINLFQLIEAVEEERKDEDYDPRETWDVIYT
jgi:hypothetical protein